MSNPLKRIVIIMILAAAAGLLVVVSMVLAGADVRVNQDPDPMLQNETSITLNPALPGNVVVGYNEAPGSGGGLGISYSFNYGAPGSWNDTQTQSPWAYSDGDPSLAADLLGNIFAAQLSYSTGPAVFPNSGIYCSISNTGGASWSVPVTIDQYLIGSSPVFFADKEHIDVDTYPNSPYKNRLYITWQRDHPNGVNSDIFFAWSGNQLATVNYATGGPVAGQISDLASFPGSPPVPSSHGNGPCPAVAPDGDVYVAWQDAPLSVQNPGRIYVDKSTDGGVTFGVDVLAVSYNTCARWPKGGSSFMVRGFPSIAVSPIQNALGNYDVYVVYAEDPDRSTDIIIESDTPLGSNSSTTPEVACYANYVYAVWVDTRDGAGNGDIYFNRSGDNGATWGTDQRINTPTTPGAVMVQTPRIAVDSSDVYVVWEDRRNGSASLYFNYSSDFGATWQTSDMRIDTGTTPGTTNAWAPQIGAYRGNVYIVWTDDRSGDADVLCNYSTNGGATFQTTPVRVDNAGAGVWANVPKLAWYGNIVHVTWYDGRNGWTDIFHNVSFDGGQTWQSSDSKLDTWTGMSIDPAIACDSNYVYVAWPDQRFGQQDIHLNYSINSGLSWQVTDIRLDMGDAAGTSTSDQVDITCVGQRAFVVWTDYRNGLADIYYNYTPDNGVSWLNPAIRIDADFVGGSHNSTSPKIGTDLGCVYVVYEDDRHGYQDIYFRYSLTNGTSWYPRDFRLDTGDYMGASGSAAPRLACFNHSVYAVWHDWRNGQADVYFSSSQNNGISWRDGPDDGDIMLIRSDNGGATWNAPVRVNNDVTTNGQFQPWIDVKPTGVIDVVWYDRRNDVNDSWLDVYIGTSGDRGMTFVNSLVSDLNFGPPPPPSIWPWPWMGEYMGVDTDSTYAYIAWTDTRNNDLDIYFDRFENPTPTGVSSKPRAPVKDYLSQNYPNPFNPATTIAFGLKEPGVVTLKIYDVAGKLVRVLVDGEREADHYQVVWDGRNNDGVRVASGVYFYRLKVRDFTRTKKLVLMK